MHPDRAPQSGSRFLCRVFFALSGLLYWDLSICWACDGEILALTGRMSDQTPIVALLADVGGTNTRVALAFGGRVDQNTVTKFRNADFPGLAEVLNTYLFQKSLRPIVGAIAVAGPVRDGSGELTNLAWKFCENGLADEIGVPRVHILNDLQAQGFAVRSLKATEFKILVKGTASPRAEQSQLVVGVGTGFNATPIHFGPAGRQVLPSECGHITLPQTNDEQRKIACWFEEQLGFASVEDALSGRGFQALYRYFSGGHEDITSAEIMSRFENGSDEKAHRNVEHFIHFLGATVGDLALTHLPLGGIYLIGGMARAVTPYFEKFNFSGAFTDKGRMRPLLEEFSIHVIEDDFAALSGCASYLEEHTKA